jgi:hypothetical protein
MMNFMTLSLTRPAWRSTDQRAFLSSKPYPKSDGGAHARKVASGRCETNSDSPAIFLFVNQKILLGARRGTAAMSNHARGAAGLPHHEAACYGWLVVRDEKP